MGDHVPFPQKCSTCSLDQRPVFFFCDSDELDLLQNGLSLFIASMLGRPFNSRIHQSANYSPKLPVAVRVLYMENSDI